MCKMLVVKGGATREKEGGGGVLLNTPIPLIKNQRNNSSPFFTYLQHLIAHQLHIHKSHYPINKVPEIMIYICTTD